MVAIVFLGCRNAAEPAGDRTAPADGGEAVQLTIVDREEYDAELAKLHGKVVLVDFWATWCGPCLEQLPHTTAMADELREQGLAVVTVNMDDPEDDAKIRSALDSRGGAATINLVSQYGGGSKGMEAFEIEGGALPQYKLYDRTGKLWRTMALDPAADEQFTSVDVAAAIAELLGE
jgi:thiol-disulfide isomerase/thioredoxin